MFSEEEIEQILEVREAGDALAASEYSDFLTKWSDSKIEVSMAMLNYDLIMATVLSANENAFGSALEPATITKEIAEQVGVIAEPLVDYVNMLRRDRIHRTIKALLQFGYIDAGLGQDGELEYVLKEREDLTEEMRLIIVRAVAADARFR